MLFKSFTWSATFAVSFSTLTSALPYVTSNLSEPTLKWAPCDLPFDKNTTDKIAGPIDCATLEVPLDYTDLSSSNNTLTLQLIKQPATKIPFKGTIIFNPGGPGVSGVEEVATKGHMYRDEIFNGQYNIVGFDTRGTGRTIPFACDPTKGSNTTTNSTSNARPIKNNDTTFASADMWNFLETKAWDDGTWYASSCANTEGIADIGRFLGTPFVVRDMVRIIDALDEDGLLRFWGRSYSTILGQTFAAMFPDRIDRMLLDSNVRANDYYGGSWLTATFGTEKSLENWLQNCIDAGAELCPGIANFTGPDTKVSDVMDALTEVFRELEENPIILPADYYLYPIYSWYRPGGLPLLLDAKYNIMRFLYRPDQAYQFLLPILTLILARDWDSYIITVPQNATATASNTTDVELPWQLGANNLHGIGCSDSKFRAQRPEDMYSVISAQSKQGSFVDAFSPQFWPCAQWPFEAAEQFEGNFQSINTSYPILFVNGAYDPITPIDKAWEVAAGFQRSMLLTHKGHGHGFMNHPSNCTIEAVRKYFFDGTLPTQGTECEPNEGIFEYASLLAGESGSGD
ncbi:hypothetical protein SLS60_007095 [Paraconiothyrium brasiliense]|uniref:Peptidase S33 tripeptidyl aminopeptidase-like C-terminal domain-containing protein n=1 Tax=Paraconiothyrium brasiliense TaxID=300254 RepID=A0ABR3R8M0_9PLEO